MLCSVFPVLATEYLSHSEKAYVSMAGHMLSFSFLYNKLLGFSSQLFTMISSKPKQKIHTGEQKKYFGGSWL